MQRGVEVNTSQTEPWQSQVLELLERAKGRIVQIDEPPEQKAGRLSAVAAIQEEVANETQINPHPEVINLAEQLSGEKFQGHF